MPRASSKVDINGDLVALGAAVRLHRKNIGLSQEALADLAKIDRSHMGKIERGERNVSVLNVLRIAHALNTTLAQLSQSADL
ncbi:XRE family transcriptional regulator [Herbaspirillum lusitanum]|uniref:helix-turn-helix domain-containing protein n=1 Tax=Herbaspirillum TaxID=963 RepID=UPI0009FB6ED5|nr:MULTISPECIES: helix-turn-helix transcriptional regulator [Herbaspirillum]MCW5300550.1 XRE family transcriptional regulator [Herbaspirillum lusitanum]